MKKHITYSCIIALFAMSSISPVLAGNGDRVGQAGAGQILINPWARSSGWASSNAASVRGLESVYSNIAGVAFTKKTEIIFARTQWLKGADININSFGLSQRVGESGVMGFSVASMNFGDINVTTADNPDGGLGVYTPQMTNINVFYAKEFSHSIYGGANMKVISESISNVSANGVAFDAGIQYVTGKFDQMKFGIALKNVGPTMSFSGDGLSEKLYNNLGTFKKSSFSKGEQFELPSSLSIGVTYDFKLAEMHRLTAAGTFVSNSFSKDNYNLGLEYGFRNYLMLRAGWAYTEKDAVSTLVTTAISGPAVGVTFEIPVGKGGTVFGVDYSYRATEASFQGIHSFGVRLSL